MLMLSGIFVSGVAKADIFSETVVSRYVGTVNGVKRELVSTTNGSGINTYLKIGEEDYQLMCTYGKEAVFDQYGAIWILDDTNPVYQNTIMWWNYELTPDFDSIYYCSYDHDVESFIFEGSGSQAVAVGYTTFSGEIKFLPSFSYMKQMEGIESFIPEPHYIPYSETATPTQETSKETAEPAGTPTVGPTQEPTKTPTLDEPTATPTVLPTSKPSAEPTAKPNQTPTSQQVTEPAKVSGVKVKNNKKSKTAVSWKKVKDASGYELQYAASKKFKNSKMKGTKKTTVTIKKLKKKKTYYFRVRAYRTIKGKEVVYGKWSSVKKIKIKK